VSVSPAPGFLVRNLFPSRLVLFDAGRERKSMLTGLADAIVSGNRLRSASKGVATSSGFGTSGTYRPKRDDQTGQQWY